MIPILKEGQFEVLGHRADTKIRAYGKTKKALFKNAALGMISILDALTDKEEKMLNFRLSSIDQDALLVDFLSELLYLIQTQKIIPQKFSFPEFSDRRLSAKVNAKKVVSFGREIKAVSYQDVAIKRQSSIWEATIIFDL